MIHPTYNIMLNLLQLHLKKRKLSIVDYGCGNGYFYSILPKERVKTYHGYDINEASIRKAKLTHTKRNVCFSTLSYGRMNEKKKSVDVMILIGVVQYMEKKELTVFLRKAKEILKKDGVLLISTLVDHKIYSLIDLYRLFLPHKSVNRVFLIQQLQSTGYNVTYSFEKGLLLSPIFAQCVVLFFDLFDKLIFKTKGELGIVGKTVRKIVNPLLQLEYVLPVDFGYTLFIQAKK